MTLAGAHKTSTYLAVGCAFLALALGGELGLGAVGLALCGIVGSWWWEPPRVSLARWQRLWTALGVGLFALSIVQFLAGGDLLILGAEFLLFLVVVKLLSRAGLRDYLQIYLLSFLLLVAATVLNSELSFGLFFLGYVVSATWALSIFHLRREVEERYVVPGPAAASTPLGLDRVLGSRRLVDRRFLVGSSLISLSVFVAAVALFLVIPRIGFGLFMSKSRGGVSMAGFSDGVQLGGHGLIRDDDTVVMRIQLERGPTGRDAPAIHWRGVAFDRYQAGEWFRSPRAPETRRQHVIDGRRVTQHLLYAGPGLEPAELARRTAEATRQDIYLEPLGYDVLFGASTPLAFEIESKLTDRAGGRRNERNDELRYPHEAGMRYVVYSELDAPSAEALRAAAHEVPRGYEVYTAVPAEITARTRELARTITAGATTDYDRVVALERWLKRNLRYTLEQRSPGRLEPIDFFLFERRAGHCEYFASALAIMARAVGVPTRNVNGFLGGEWNEYDDYLAVRAGDAHSWVEAFFPGHGWVTFDPTPSIEASGLGRGGDGPLDRLRRLADTLRFKWFKWVIEYDLVRQLSLIKKLGGLLGGSASKLLRAKGQALKAWVRAHRAGAAAGAAGVVLVAAAIALRRRRRHPDARLGVASRPRGPRPAATAAYFRVLRRLARRGEPRPSAMTPREHARELGRRGVAGADALAELVELHYAAEFGAGGSELDRRAAALEAAIGTAHKAARRSPRRA